MKYVMSWTARSGGSGAENEATQRRVLDVFSKWSPPAGVIFHQFLTRLDGQGGFSVVETDDPGLILGDTAKFGPWFEFDVHPVMDVMESVPVLNDAVEFRSSIS